MKYFDSIKNNSWVGQNFNINKNNCLIILKNAKLSEKLDLEVGSYSIRVVGKKRTGDGTVSINIKGPDNEKILEETFQFTKSSWTEASFNFSINHKLLYGMLEILRNKNMFGSVEIARIIIDGNNKENHTPAKIREELKNKKQNVRYIHSGEQPPLVKKKIAFIVPYSIFGGAEVYIVNMINQLKENHEITLLCLQKNNIGKFISYKNINHIEVKGLDNLSGYLKTFDFDYIVYYNRLDVYKLLENLTFNRSIKAKLIEICHSEFLWPGAIAAEKTRKVLDLLVAVSPNIGHDIAVPSTTRKVLIPTGIDLDKFKSRAKQDIKNKLNITHKNIIGAVARLSKEKNLDYLLDLSKQLKDFEFVVIGDGNEKTNLMNRIKKENIPNMHLIGFKSNTELYYNIFDAFVLPSSIEGLPISILESMASEVPVYCTNVGDISSVVKDGGNGYFLSLDPERDSSLIKETYKNKNIIEKALLGIRLTNDVSSISKMFFESIFSLDDNYVKYEKQKFQFLLPGQYI